MRVIYTSKYFSAAWIQLWYPIVMQNSMSRLVKTIFLFCFLLVSTGLHAQRERQIPAPDSEQFGTKFFDQLSSIFGKFRDSDLQRVFQLAQPIQCSELVSGKGEWRPVAFFNENRKLGDWYRSNLEEVRTDLSVYLFKGTCQSDHGTIQLTTKFPVGESIDAYNAGRIPFDQIDINVNAPVNVAYDSRTGAYAFDLPFLYLISHQATSSVYSLIPQHFGDKYATEVTNPWDCKSVSSIDITYRFLICRTSTQDRAPSGRNQQRTPPSFGSSAYFILSDGSEAQSTVTLNFGGADTPVPAPVPTPPPPSAPSEPGVIGWQPPAYRSQILDAGKSDFRIRFNAQAWMDRLGSSQVLSNQRIASLQSAKPQDGADYCVWSPGSSDMISRLLSEEPDKEVSYSVTGTDKGAGQSAASVNFVMKTLTGTRLGTLQCFFPRSDTAGTIGYDRWSAIVGSQLKLEVRP
jgi:hypothetical protein